MRTYADVCWHTVLGGRCALPEDAGDLAEPPDLHCHDACADTRGAKVGAHSVHWLYGYKRTKTDAAAAAGPRR
jgi:hypothetical protein